MWGYGCDNRYKFLFRILVARSVNLLYRFSQDNLRLRSFKKVPDARMNSHAAFVISCSDKSCGSKRDVAWQDSWDSEFYDRLKG